jgi:serine/threonine protein kinase
MVKAVEFFHKNNVAHRDTKPTKVLVDYQKDFDVLLKLMDFGYNHIEVDNYYMDLKKDRCNHNYIQYISPKISP